MGVFDDKKFEQLDWMTQITETIESDMNTALAKLPDKVVIDLAKLKSFMGGSYRGLYLDMYQVVRTLIRTNIVNSNSLTWDDERKLTSCFQFEVNPDTILDLENNTLSHDIIVTKVIKTFEDQDLQQLMGRKGLDAIRPRNFQSDSATLTRMNEVMELLGNLEADMKHKSAKKKMLAIKHRLETIFKTNEWRIRSTELADKVCAWVSSYISSGNLAALTNFCKLKVMTHNNMPIYSVQEEQI